MAEAAEKDGLPQPESLLPAARELAPRIRGRAADMDRDCRLPPDLVEAFLDAGFFHALLPRDAGGVQADPVTAARLVEEVARADGSAGWCVMIAAQCASFAGFLPLGEARAIWGRRDVVAGTARPIGRAQSTRQPAPGYVVSGRWPFASGSSHATWFAGECMVYDEDGKPLLDGADNQRSRMVFVPAAEVALHETWDTLGLRGTASNDFSIERAFVPAQRGFQVVVDPPRHDWGVYRAPPLVFMNHGAHSLGIARAAIDTAIEIGSSKTGWGGVLIKSTPAFQAAIAEATVTVDAAARQLYETAAELWERVQAGKDDPASRASVRLATSHAASSSLQAVDLLHGFLATSSIFKKTPLERHFRDIHTAAAHVMIGPLTYQAAGRVLLGMEADFPFF